MEEHPWVTNFPGAVIVCDPNGIVLELNEKAALNYAADGGLALIGTNLLDCHPAEARGKLEAMLAEKRLNVYSIEKNGLKKLIYQTPWYQDGQYAGFIEMSLEIPFEMPHFIRG